MQNEDRITEALDAIQAQLRKRQMCLVHKPDCMVLAIRDKRGLGTFKALAQVAFIAPIDLRWRPVTDIVHPEEQPEPWRSGKSQ